MNYKILNKTLFICDKWGNIGKRISENVAFGTFDDKTSVSKMPPNTVKLLFRI